MSLIGLMNDFASECVLLTKTRRPDGEGGWDTVWTEGERFTAAITYDTTLNARVAESEGMMSTYTVTTAKNQPLDYHDVFRRVSDGKVFRVTSNGDDKKTPQSASFDVSQVAAQEWELA